MTRYNESERKLLSDQIVGKKISEFYYEPDGDYYVMTFDDGSETSVRLMADLV